MSLFREKQIGPREALGAVLRKRREALGIPLRTVSNECTIAARYLSAIEEGKYEALPGLMYGKNFVKRYALFLGLSGAPLLRRFSDEYTSRMVARQSNMPVSEQRVWVTPRRVRFALAAVVLGLCTSYFGGEVVALMRAPTLELVTPERDAMTTERAVTVSGTVDPTATVMVNGTAITHREGSFSTQVDLRDGVNTITVRAFRRHGKPHIESRRVVRVTEARAGMTRDDAPPRTL